MVLSHVLALWMQVCGAEEMSRANYSPLHRTTAGKCFYCGHPIPNGGKFIDKRDWILTDPQHIYIREHKIPQSRGGPDHKDNYVPSCGRCNKTKHSFTIDEYRFIQGLRRRDPQFVFPFEERSAVRRDWLCVHSDDFEKAILLANMPDAIKGYRRAWSKEKTR